MRPHRHGQQLRHRGPASAAVTGAIFAALAGVAGLLLGVVALLTSHDEAATVFGLVAAGAGLVAVLPLLTAFPRTRETA